VAGAQKLEKLAEANVRLAEDREPEEHQRGQRAHLGHAEDRLDRGTEVTPRNVGHVSTRSSA